MLNKVLLSLGLLLMLLTASRCKKDKPITHCQGYVACDPFMKALFLFKDSSYWIYRDSVSGDIDSVWSWNYRRKEYWPHAEVASSNSPCFEQFGYALSHSYRNLVEGQKIYYIYQKNPVNYDKLNYVFEIASEFRNVYQQRFIFSTKDSFWPFPSYGEGNVGRLSELKVRDTVYKTLVYLSYPSPNGSDWVKRIYYAKNVGVVKYEDDNGGVWELVRYKVRQ